MKGINSYLNDFQKSIHNDNKRYKKEVYDIIESHYKKAKDKNEFLELLAHDEKIKFEQITSQLLKNSDYEWYYARSMMKDVFKTDSDCGGLKVGNDDFYIIVPNGYGDGVTRVSVQEKGTINHNTFKLFTSIEGKFNIYDYDCGDTIIRTIEGRYFISYFEGLIVFEKLS